jgi:ATP-dependent Zn protease
LFGTRTNAGQQASARWHTSMLTEFMQEMDGLLSSQVIVIGATN